MRPVLAAGGWHTNAALIADVHRLGYILNTDRVLDPTYGRGLWWSEYRPPLLEWSDIATGVDFRFLPHVANTFDVVAYDPPYVCVGGRETTTLVDYFERYGMADAPYTPKVLQTLMNAGLAECARVVKPGGLILMKCQDYITSGKLWPGTHHSATYAIDLGLTIHDRFEHIAGVRPQPPNRRQVHARRNLSTLFVFRKTKKRS